MLQLLPPRPPTHLPTTSEMPLPNVFENAVRPMTLPKRCLLSLVPHLPLDVATLPKWSCRPLVLVQRSSLRHFQSALLLQLLHLVALLLRRPSPLSIIPPASRRAVISALPRLLALRDRYRTLPPIRFSLRSTCCSPG